MLKTVTSEVCARVVSMMKKQSCEIQWKTKYGSHLKIQINAKRHCTACGAPSWFIALLITSSGASRATNTIKVPADLAQPNSSQIQTKPECRSQPCDVG